MAQGKSSPLWAKNLGSDLELKGFASFVNYLAFGQLEAAVALAGAATQEGPDANGDQHSALRENYRSSLRVLLKQSSDAPSYSKANFALSRNFQVALSTISPSLDCFRLALGQFSRRPEAQALGLFPATAEDDAAANSVVGLEDEDPASTVTPNTSRPELLQRLVAIVHALANLVVFGHPHHPRDGPSHSMNSGAPLEDLLHKRNQVLTEYCFPILDHDPSQPMSFHYFVRLLEYLDAQCAGRQGCYLSTKLRSRKGAKEGLPENHPESSAEEHIANEQPWDSSLVVLELLWENCAPFVSARSVQQFFNPSPETASSVEFIEQYSNNVLSPVGKARALMAFDPTKAGVALSSDEGAWVNSAGDQGPQLTSGAPVTVLPTSLFCVSENLNALQYTMLVNALSVRPHAAMFLEAYIHYYEVSAPNKVERRGTLLKGPPPPPGPGTPEWVQYVGALISHQERFLDSLNSSELKRESGASTTQRNRPVAGGRPASHEPTSDGFLRPKYFPHLISHISDQMMKYLSSAEGRGDPKPTSGGTSTGSASEDRERVRFLETYFEPFKAIKPYVGAELYGTTNGRRRIFLEATLSDAGHSMVLDYLFPEASKPSTPTASAQPFEEPWLVIKQLLDFFLKIVGLRKRFPREWKLRCIEILTTEVFTLPEEGSALRRLDERPLLLLYLLETGDPLSLLLGLDFSSAAEELSVRRPFTEILIETLTQTSGAVPISSFLKSSLTEQLLFLHCDSVCRAVLPDTALASPSNRKGPSAQGGNQRGATNPALLDELDKLNEFLKQHVPQSQREKTLGSLLGILLSLVNRDILVPEGLSELRDGQVDVTKAVLERLEQLQSMTLLIVARLTCMTSTQQLLVSSIVYRLRIASTYIRSHPIILKTLVPDLFLNASGGNPADAGVVVAEAPARRAMAQCNTFTDFVFGRSPLEYILDAIEQSNFNAVDETIRALFGVVGEVAEVEGATTSAGEREQSLSLVLHLAVLCKRLALLKAGQLSIEEAIPSLNACGLLQPGEKAEEDVLFHCSTDLPLTSVGPHLHLSPSTSASTDPDGEDLLPLEKFRSVLHSTVLSLTGTAPSGPVRGGTTIKHFYSKLSAYALRPEVSIEAAQKIYSALCGEQGKAIQRASARGATIQELREVLPSELSAIQPWNTPFQNDSNTAVQHQSPKSTSNPLWTVISHLEALSLVLDALQYSAYKDLEWLLSNGYQALYKAIAQGKGETIATCIAQLEEKGTPLGGISLAHCQRIVLHFTLTNNYEQGTVAESEWLLMEAAVCRFLGEYCCGEGLALLLMYCVHPKDGLKISRALEGQGGLRTEAGKLVDRWLQKQFTKADVLLSGNPNFAQTILPRGPWCTAVPGAQDESQPDPSAAHRLCYLYPGQLPPLIPRSWKEHCIAVQGSSSKRPVSPTPTTVEGGSKPVLRPQPLADPLKFLMTFRDEFIPTLRDGGELHEMDEGLAVAFTIILRGLAAQSQTLSPQHRGKVETTRYPRETLETFAKELLSHISNIDLSYRLVIGSMHSTAGPTAGGTMSVTSAPPATLLRDHVSFTTQYEMTQSLLLMCSGIVDKDSGKGEKDKVPAPVPQSGSPGGSVDKRTTQTTACKASLPIQCIMGIQTAMREIQFSREMRDRLRSLDPMLEDPLNFSDMRYQTVELYVRQFLNTTASAEAESGTPDRTQDLESAMMLLDLCRRKGPAEDANLVTQLQVATNFHILVERLAIAENKYKEKLAKAAEVGKDYPSGSDRSRVLHVATAFLFQVAANEFQRYDHDGKLVVEIRVPRGQENSTVTVRLVRMIVENEERLLSWDVVHRCLHFALNSSINRLFLADPSWRRTLQGIAVIEAANRYAPSEVAAHCTSAFLPYPQLLIENFIMNQLLEVVRPVLQHAGLQLDETIVHYAFKALDFGRYDDLSEQDGFPFGPPDLLVTAGRTDTLPLFPPPFHVHLQPGCSETELKQKRAHFRFLNAPNLPLFKGLIALCQDKGFARQECYTHAEQLFNSLGEVDFRVRAMQIEAAETCMECCALPESPGEYDPPEVTLLWKKFQVARHLILARWESSPSIAELDNPESVLELLDQLQEKAYVKAALAIADAASADVSEIEALWLKQATNLLCLGLFAEAESVIAHLKPERWPVVMQLLEDVVEATPIVPDTFQATCGGQEGTLKVITQKDIPAVQAVRREGAKRIIERFGSVKDLVQYLFRVKDMEAATKLTLSHQPEVDFLSTLGRPALEAGYLGQIRRALRECDPSLFSLRSHLQTLNDYLFQQAEFAELLEVQKWMHDYDGAASTAIRLSRTVGVSKEQRLEYLVFAENMLVESRYQPIEGPGNTTAAQGKLDSDVRMADDGVVLPPKRDDSPQKRTKCKLEKEMVSLLVRLGIKDIESYSLYDGASVTSQTIERLFVTGKKEFFDIANAAVRELNLPIVLTYANVLLRLVKEKKTDVYDGLLDFLRRSIIVTNADRHAIVLQLIVYFVNPQTGVQGKVPKQASALLSFMQGNPTKDRIRANFYCQQYREAVEDARRMQDVESMAWIERELLAIKDQSAEVKRLGQEAKEFLRQVRKF